VKAGVPVFAEGRCIKLGKRIAFMEADLTDGEGRLLARLTTSAVPVEIPEGGGNLVERK
jgi:acyl-coenzyme A thioesterase PaaI-like protein